jgi:hypothetical protein
MTRGILKLLELSEGMEFYPRFGASLCLAAGAKFFVFYVGRREEFRKPAVPPPSAAD